MSDIAIQVERVSKRYQLGPRVPYRTLRDQIAGLFSAPFRRAASAAAPEDPKKVLWALRDVSLEVPRGQVVGIIGRNGAGKSTLLKILSRITYPTEGQARIRGRVGSLLEVGTGFHPELTGRENTFLNGAILGMKKAEIAAKFDEIVAFAELERFIDTPVKHYSSGMYTRLAFAVAAHLEPEILFIDEVLAVGDVAFQKRCLGKMQSVTESGRTILFVSHNMGAIERLCSSVVVLSEGRTRFLGPTAEGISLYLKEVGGQAVEWAHPAPPKDRPHFVRATLCGPDGAPCARPTSAGQVGVKLELCFPAAARDLTLVVDVHNQLQQTVFTTTPLDVGRQMPAEAGTWSVVVLFPNGIFMPKRYWLSLVLYRQSELLDVHRYAMAFDVAEVASLYNLQGSRPGDLQIVCEWREFVRVTEAAPSATQGGA